MRGLARAKRQLRMRALGDALAIGSIVASLSSLATPSRVGVIIGVLGFVTAASWGLRRSTRHRAALALDACSPASHNLLVTSEEALSGRYVHPIVARELFAQAATTLENRPASSTSGLSFARWMLTVGIVSASVALIWRTGTGQPPLAPDRQGVSPLAASAETQLRVTVTPPLYTKRPRIIVENPDRVDVIEGSALHLQVTGTAGRVDLIEAGREPVAFLPRDDGAHLDLVAATSRVLLVRSAAERLVQVHVEPDMRPVVTIARPGRDLIFSSPDATVPLMVKAQDDLSIASMSLRYTKISGGGETFTFQEGEIQLKPVGDPDSKSLQATVTLKLKDLNLADGDALVYRGIARDERPGADPGVSDSFLIEIGKRGEAFSTGFAVPDDRDRQALSQQMLIMKTERLHAERQRLPVDAVLDQSRLLAVEQRMVRAEFLFMTGGEVVDEVEEAAQSDALAQGRFENRGQRELLTAIREMSRAEARLNTGDTLQALAFERSALTALQRAFDRRRYFLRTLPERARIDRSRRLSGDLRAARSSTRAVLPTPEDPSVTAARQTLRDLATAIVRQSGLGAELAARIVAIDPQWRAFQQSASQLSGARSLDERLSAAQAAQMQLATWLRQHLATAPLGKLRRDPLAGTFVEQLQRTGAPP